ncbi:MAG: hypothetical protein E7463_04750 [Ruminococcaceae bacterium]|nr:hypothetical protein [Oscillospiraceae bacterium]
MDNPNSVLVGETDVAFDKLFRTALGGFNKDDVINYLERMARNRKKDTERYAAHIRKLESEIESLKAGMPETVRTELPGDNSRLSVLESENAALRSEIEVLRLQASESAALAETAAEAPAQADAGPDLQPAVNADACPAAPAQAEAEDASASLIEELREENASLTMCYTELSKKCAVLEEKLRANEVEKLRLGEVEAAAHRNAEKIEAEARARANETLSGVAERAAAMQERLAEVTRGIDETTRAIYAELSDCGLRYSALRREADDLRAALNALRQD